MRPISTLLPTALPPVTASQLAGWADGAFEADIPDPYSRLLGALTHDRLVARQTLRQAITQLRRARTLRQRQTNPASRAYWEATVLMLWRLSREVGR